MPVPILISIGKGAASILLPIAAWMGLSWAVTPEPDMTLTYVLLGIMALIAIGLALIAWRMYA